MLWKLAVVFLVLWYGVLRWKRRRIIALSKQLSPSNIALPFVGHSYLFLGSDEDRMSMLKKIGAEAIENGGLISHWQGSRLYILVSDPVAAEVALKKCLEKDDVARFFRVLLGNGSIFAPVPIWRPRRKILAPTFSTKNLNRFVEAFVRQSNIMVNQLKSVSGKGACSVWKYFTTYTMDSVCETTLGIQVNAQFQPEQPFLHAFETVCRVDAKRTCQPWLHSDRVYKFFCPDTFKLYNHCKHLIWDFMDQIIASKLETLSKEERNKLHKMPENTLKTFLELLIESSPTKESNKLELREETLVIVLAGTDTSAVGAAFTTVMLAKHPEVQDKVYQELQEVFGDSDRKLTPEDLPRLKYLDAVIRETLRLYPPVPFIVRKVEQDIVMPSGVTLVEGCGIFISIWSIHRNRHYWGEDAEQFRPERFLNTELKHPAAFMPFSYGPRSCLGYQYAMSSMKTVISTLLRTYRVSPQSDIYTGKELRVKFDIMMKDVNDFVVQLDLRT